MADKKISALDAIVSVDDADVLPIVDASVSTTKKINVSQVKALAPVQSVASKTGAVTLVKGDVGLGNVDNTSDADKPISSATQTALNAKQNTLISGTNIKTINDESILGSGNITISGGGGISDGDKGDITVSDSGATWTIDNGVVTDAKLSTGIDAAKIADGSVSNAEFQYIGGLTSDAQTQINAKQATITGAATTITSSDLTASRAVTSSATGKIEVSSVTSTELGYVSGVTSAIQTQINAKQATITGGATSITSSDLTVSRALVSDGSGKVAVSDVTSTELGYLDGVTSAVQTQLDAKIAKFDGTTYDVNALAAVSQAEYDAIGTKSATTLYFII